MKEGGQGEGIKGAEMAQNQSEEKMDKENRQHGERCKNNMH